MTLTQIKYQQYKQLGRCVSCGMKLDGHSKIHCEEHRNIHKRALKTYHRYKYERRNQHVIGHISRMRIIKDTNKIIENGIDYDEQFYSDEEYFDILLDYGLIF